jgi:hypothetical protein
MDLKWRVVELWHGPNQVWNNGEPSMLQTKEWANLSSASALGRFVEFIAAHGYNGIDIWGEPDCEPKAYAALNEYLLQNGIRLILRREYNELMRGVGWQPDPADGFLGLQQVPKSVDWPSARPWSKTLLKSTKLCPYGPVIKEYWSERAARDAGMMPGLGGYRMCTTEHWAHYGGPWLCDCSLCTSKSRWERTRDGANAIGGILARYGMTLFFEPLQDNPAGVCLEAELESNLAGELRPNVFHIVKDHYWDHHPVWPEHPLQDVIATDRDGNSPFLTSTLMGHDHNGYCEEVLCDVEWYSKVFRRMDKSGQQGLWLMCTANPREPWDNPLNMVHWYALECFMKNPQEDPGTITKEWAAKEFGNEIAPIVLEIMRKATDANLKISHFKGGWIQYHTYMAPLWYLDSRLCGPYMIIDRVPGMMGMELPVDAYLPERAAELRGDPELILAFGRKVPITMELKTELIGQLQDAFDLYDQSIVLWKGIKNSLSKDVYEYTLTSMEGRKGDAFLWRAQMDMYMDWKLGQLTEARIDELVESCRKIKGTRWVEDPMDPSPDTFTPGGSSIAAFANDLKSELREPRLEEFFRSLPKLDDAWGYGMTQMVGVACYPDNPNAGLVTAPPAKPEA